MSSNALATMSPADLANGDTEEGLELIRKTYAKDLTNDEFALVVLEAKSRGLSAVNKELVGIKFQGKMSTFVTLSGLRKLATRSGDLAESEGPFWKGKTGAWTDAWLEDEPPAVAKFIVYRRGAKIGIPGIAIWKERAQYYFKDGKRHLSPTWAAMPAHMLAKVAETDALKRARLVPDDLAVYIDDNDQEWGDESEAPRQTDRRDQAMRRLHAAGKAKGIDHAGVRSIVSVVQPGSTSLASDEVSAIDMQTAADIIGTFDEDEVFDIVNGRPAEDDDDGDPTPRELYRNDVKEAFSTGEVDAIKRVTNLAKANSDGWRWEDLAELAPTPAYRDRIIDLARSAGVSQQALDAAVARRADTVQVKRAAQAQANPMFELGNNPDQYTR